MMPPLFKIIKKNLKLLLRSKSSALIMILGPLFLILILGIAFNNTNSMSLNIGVYSEEYNDHINSFIDKLAEKQYNIEKTTSELACINKIKINKIHACVIFPKDLDLEKGMGDNTITFYVDNSRVNMVFIIIESLSSKFSEKSKEIAMDLTNTLLQKLENTRVEIFNRKPLLSEIKKGNINSMTQLEQIKLDLNSLDVSIDTNEFQVSDINKKLSTLKSGNSNVKSKLTSILSELQGIDSDVSSLQTESNTASITSLKSVINETMGFVNTATSLIDDSDSGTSKQITELQLLISNININIERTKNKMDSLSSSRADISSKLDSAKSQIGSVNDKIINIENSFKKIDENIGSIQITDADKIVSPIKTNIKGIETEITYLEGLFPNLLMIVIMFISILLSTSLIMMEKSSPAYFRNKITPLSDLVFLLSNYLTSLIIVTTQVLIIVLISSLLFKIKLILPIMKMLPFLIVIISLFSFLGILIGQIFKSEEAGEIAAISLSTVLLFLSDIIVPLGMMPETIRSFARYSPLILSSDLLKIGLKHDLLSGITNFYFLLLYTIILLILIIGFQKLSSKNYFTKLILAKQKEISKKEKVNIKKHEHKLLFNKK